MPAARAGLTVVFAAIGFLPKQNVWSRADAKWCSMYGGAMNRSASNFKVLRSLQSGLVDTARKAGCLPTSLR
jgi:hypothetical protein